MKKNNFKSSVWACSLALLFLNSSCMAPLALIGLAGYSGARGMDRYADEYPIIDEEWTDYENGNGQYLYAYWLGPVEEETGEGIVYTGHYNAFFVEISEGMSYDDLEFIPTMGTILPGADPGVYNLLIDVPNAALEIVIRNKKDESVQSAVFCRSVRLPDPIVHLGPKDQNGKMELASFKELSKIMLETGHLPVTVLCLCNSFKLTRIAVNGSRESALSSATKTNFSAEAKSLIAKAQVGDIYILEEIAVTCPGDKTPRILRSLVYTLQ